ncbi:hypothetical protein [Actinoallomurus sp. NPDC052274]|uniref:hypothetical protein n=1 Tax=Actinoallomurus sp. NPDC052274 TaxID=3155420 RepID=UPI00344A672B
MDVMFRDDVGRLFGVSHELVRDWQRRSAKTDDPTPTPDGKAGARPFWFASREQEWRDWYARRPGKGVGGGRPKGSKTKRRSAARPSSAS